MTSSEIKKLLSLSKNQKLKIVHTLWNDIAKEQDQVKTDSSHIELLEKRLARIKSGKAKFKSWDDVKKKYFEKS